MISYLAAFVEGKSIRTLHQVMNQDQLAKKPHDPPHLTFAFMPTPTQTAAFQQIEGQVINLQIVGIGNDGQNAGVKVEISEDVKPYYDGQPIPHITTSLMHSAKAKDTGKLEFIPITPVMITARMGYCKKKDR